MGHKKCREDVMDPVTKDAGRVELTTTMQGGRNWSLKAGSGSGRMEIMFQIVRKRFKRERTSNNRPFWTGGKQCYIVFTHTTRPANENGVAK